VADSFRHNRYRLPAKFYIIMATAMWAGVVGAMVMAFLGAMRSRPNGTFLPVPDPEDERKSYDYRITHGSGEHTI
jgi:hypothetical protein